MQLIAGHDSFGNRENFTSDQMRHILDLIDGYMKVPYTIHDIYIDNVFDKHGRVDITVEFYDQNSMLVQQKLLILDDELIDGPEFHRRYKTWYEDK